MAQDIPHRSADTVKAVVTVGSVGKPDTEAAAEALVKGDTSARFCYEAGKRARSGDRR